MLANVSDLSALGVHTPAGECMCVTHLEEQQFTAEVRNSVFLIITVEADHLGAWFPLILNLLGRTESLSLPGILAMPLLVGGRCDVLSVCAV